MEHGFLDKYAVLKSPFHRVEPRVKLVIFTGTIFYISLSPPEHFYRILMVLAASIFLALISKVPLKVYLYRLLAVLPVLFVLSAVYSFSPKGFLWQDFYFFLLRATTSFLLIILLVTTTRFDALLSALRFFKMPIIIISILSFLYRYIFVIQDELERMLRAKQARTVKKLQRKDELKTYFNLTAILFLRSFERSERIHRAMLSRGYKAEAIYPITPVNLRKIDFVFLFSFLIFILLVNSVSVL